MDKAVESDGLTVKLLQSCATPGLALAARHPPPGGGGRPCRARLANSIVLMLMRATHFHTAHRLAKRARAAGRGAP